MFGAITPLSVLALLSGCASASGGSDASRPADGVVVGESGYRTVQVTGSHIPVRVPTSPTARPLPSALPVRTMSLEEFDRLVRRGQR